MAIEIGGAVNEAAFLPGHHKASVGPASSGWKDSVAGGTPSVSPIAPTVLPAGPASINMRQTASRVSLRQRCELLDPSLRFHISFIEMLSMQPPEEFLPAVRLFFPAASLLRRLIEIAQGEVTFGPHGAHAGHRPFDRHTNCTSASAAIIRLPSSTSGMTSVAPAAFERATSVSSATRTTMGIVPCLTDQTDDPFSGMGIGIGDDDAARTRKPAAFNTSVRSALPKTTVPCSGR